MTQVSQAQGQLWSALDTEVNQTFATTAEIHNGAAYWVIDTRSFDQTGRFTMTNQGYVSAAHEDLEMPAMAAEGTGGNGKAIMLFTLNGNGGPGHADHGGFFPSTAYGRLTADFGRPDRVGDQHRGSRALAAGRIHRVPARPGRQPPAPLGRLQLGDLPARRQRPVVLCQRVHPVP